MVPVSPPTDRSTLTYEREPVRPATRMALLVIASPDVAAVGREVGPGPTVIGRAVEGPETVVIDDPRLSRSHVRLAEVAHDRWLLEDLGSKNGVFVNGRRVTSGIVVAGDVLRLGDTLVSAEPERGIVGDDLGLLGSSRIMAELREQLERAAGESVTVLLRGDSGTGKELAAAALHRLAGGAGPFVPVNCAGIPESLAESQLFGHVKGAFTGAVGAADGLFRSAHGGTLFLDEVAELPAAIQAKLLRAVEYGEVLPVGGTTPHRVHLRIVAATHRDLEAAVAEGVFRGDLFARLRERVIVIPPLRERRGDVPELAAHFLPSGAAALHPDVLEALLLWTWPYNVRELRAVCRGGLRGGPTLAALPAEIRDHLEKARAAETAAPVDGSGPTAEELVALLDRFDGNVRRIASHLGKDRKQVYRWIERHGVDPARHRAK